MCEICSKLTIKTLERRHLLHFGVFIVNFGTCLTACSSVFTVNLEQANSGWVDTENLG